MAQRSMELRPKMAAISSNASVSSLELNTGNLCVRMERRMTPADHMSMAEWSAESSYTVCSTLTDSLIRTFEQDFWRSETSCSRSIRLDCRSLVVVAEPNLAFPSLRPLPSVIYCLFDRAGIIRLGPRAMQVFERSRSVLTRRPLGWHVSLRIS